MRSVKTVFPYPIEFYLWGTPLLNNVKLDKKRVLLVKVFFTYFIDYIHLPVFS